MKIKTDYGIGTLVASNVSKPKLKNGQYELQVLHTVVMSQADLDDEVAVLNAEITDLDNEKSKKQEKLTKFSDLGY